MKEPFESHVVEAIAGEAFPFFLNAVHDTMTARFIEELRAFRSGERTSYELQDLDPNDAEDCMRAKRRLDGLQEAIVDCLAADQARVFAERCEEQIEERRAAFRGKKKSKRSR